MTIAQACEYWQVAHRAMYLWINSGKVVTRRTPGGRYRIRVEVMS